MDLTRHGPIALAESRLAWLDTRQRILARNVANADTPGFRPSDAVPFGEILQRRRHGAAMTTTDANHVAPRGSGALTVQDRDIVERSRNGNAVSLDAEALRIAETDQAHALAMGLHRKYLGLFRTALGRN
ncbi:flagellar biosynthesis protein FlgB [Roseococcus sp. SYP-B2431]|uniref:flagellar basal body rod protein FlgB n=1 Tax=Roseococcus sp. SYP-B2431 TaxID=2496640 RepID=UPI00103A8F67|nr:flagellar basal body protein [Roseococcus sp. SYP-B2431]TCH97163.1 flagellar biosynthesis protein FlgB [Roseococcus sp. SYP-B2431]